MFDYGSIFNLDGKVALVVGAASGLGEASALGLAAHGASVYCADINLSGAQGTAEAIRGQGGQAEGLVLDICDEAMIAEVVNGVGTIDILVSTPSINVRKPMLEITGDEFDRVVGLNLKGTFLLGMRII